MPSLMATLVRQLVLVLCVTAGDDPAVRTPVFRGAMALSGRAIALFEVQGNAGTWQGEVGRTLPGSTWRIEAIDLATGRVTIRPGQKPPVSLGQGDTYQSDRVVKAPEPARAPAPLPRAEQGIGLVGGPGNATLERELRRQLADPRMRKQLESMGLPLPALFGPPATRPGAIAGQSAIAARQPARPTAAPPAPPIVSNVPLVRALDASVTVPPIARLGKPGYQTVVMVLSSADAACRALKPKVMSLTRRPRTAVVFVEAGDRPDAPVKSAWNVGELPHFMLIDPGGGVLGSGESARRVVDSWLAAK